MKLQDKRKMGALRMLKSALTVAEKSGTTVEWMKVFQSEAKKRQQAADGFESGGAADRAQDELYEKSLIETYLPQKQSKEDTEKKLREIVGELGFTSQKDMGKLIKEFQLRYPGLQEGSVVSGLCKEILS